MFYIKNTKKLFVILFWMIAVQTSAQNVQARDNKKREKFTTRSVANITGATRKKRRPPPSPAYKESTAQRIRRTKPKKASQKPSQNIVTTTPASSAASWAPLIKNALNFGVLFTAGMTLYSIYTNLAKTPSVSFPTPQLTETPVSSLHGFSATQETLPAEETISSSKAIPSSEKDPLPAEETISSSEAIPSSEKDLLSETFTLQQDTNHVSTKDHWINNTSIVAALPFVFITLLEMKTHILRKIVSTNFECLQKDSDPNGPPSKSPHAKLREDLDSILKNGLGSYDDTAWHESTEYIGLLKPDDIPHMAKSTTIMFLAGKNGKWLNKLDQKIQDLKSAHGHQNEYRAPLNTIQTIIESRKNFEKFMTRGIYTPECLLHTAKSEINNISPERIQSIPKEEIGLLPSEVLYELLSRPPETPLSSDQMDGITKDQCYSIQQVLQEKASLEGALDANAEAVKELIDDRLLLAGTHNDSISIRDLLVQFPVRDGQGIWEQQEKIKKKEEEKKQRIRKNLNDLFSNNLIKPHKDDIFSQRKDYIALLEHEDYLRITPLAAGLLFNGKEGLQDLKELIEKIKHEKHSEDAVKKLNDILAYRETVEQFLQGATPYDKDIGAFLSFYDTKKLQANIKPNIPPEEIHTLPISAICGLLYEPSELSTNQIKKISPKQFEAFLNIFPPRTRVGPKHFIACLRNKEIAKTLLTSEKMSISTSDESVNKEMEQEGLFHKKTENLFTGLDIDFNNDKKIVETLSQLSRPIRIAICIYNDNITEENIGKLIKENEKEALQNAQAQKKAYDDIPHMTKDDLEKVDLQILQSYVLHGRVTEEQLQSIDEKKRDNLFQNIATTFDNNYLNQTGTSLEKKISLLPEKQKECVLWKTRYLQSSFEKFFKTREERKKIVINKFNSILNGKINPFSPPISLDYTEPLDVEERKKIFKDVLSFIHTHGVMPSFQLRLEDILLLDPQDFDKITPVVQDILFSKDLAMLELIIGLMKRKTDSLLFSEVIKKLEIYVQRQKVSNFTSGTCYDEIGDWLTLHDIMKVLQNRDNPPFFILRITAEKLEEFFQKEPRVSLPDENIKKILDAKDERAAILFKYGQLDKKIEKNEFSDQKMRLILEKFKIDFTNKDDVERLKKQSLKARIAFCILRQTTEEETAQIITSKEEEKALKNAKILRLSKEEVQNLSLEDMKNIDVETLANLFLRRKLQGSQLTKIGHESVQENFAKMVDKDIKNKNSDSDFFIKQLVLLEEKDVELVWKKTSNPDATLHILFPDEDKRKKIIEDDLSFLIRNPEEAPRLSARRYRRFLENLTHEECEKMTYETAAFLFQGTIGLSALEKLKNKMKTKLTEALDSIEGNRYKGTSEKSPQLSSLEGATNNLEEILSQRKKVEGFIAGNIEPKDEINSLLTKSDIKRLSPEKIPNIPVKSIINGKEEEKKEKSHHQSGKNQNSYGDQQDQDAPPRRSPSLSAKGRMHEQD